MSYVAGIRTGCISLFLSLCVFAQRDLGTLAGTVTDAQGGVVANAKISITEQSTGQKYDLETNSVGEFVRPALQPGTYSIEVSAPGFKKTVRPGVLVTGGDRVAVSLQLTVG